MREFNLSVHKTVAKNSKCNLTNLFLGKVGWHLFGQRDFCVGSDANKQLVTELHNDTFNHDMIKYDCHYRVLKCCYSTNYSKVYFLANDTQH